MKQHCATQKHQKAAEKRNGGKALFKFEPSSDVERSFSDFKPIFFNRRRTFLFENLKQHAIIHCKNFIFIVKMYVFLNFLC